MPAFSSTTSAISSSANIIRPSSPASRCRCRSRPIEGVKIALLTILVYLVALPFVLVAGAGFLIFFIATAWLQGKQYFELAAMRFRPPAEAKAMRKHHAATVFTAGLFIAAFVSIPIVNLATPLFGMAFMVHMHKRLSGPRPELIEPRRRSSVPTARIARERRDQQADDREARQHHPGFVDAKRQGSLFDQRPDIGDLCIGRRT